MCYKTKCHIPQWNMILSLSRMIADVSSINWSDWHFPMCKSPGPITCRTSILDLECKWALYWHYSYHPRPWCFPPNIQLPTNISLLTKRPIPTKYSLNTNYSLHNTYALPTTTHQRIIVNHIFITQQTFITHQMFNAQQQQQQNAFPNPNILQCNKLICYASAMFLDNVIKKTYPTLSTC